MRHLFALLLTCLTFGQTAFGGLYLEYKNTFTGKSSGTGHIKMWVQDGNSRTEMTNTFDKKDKEMEEAEKMGINVGLNSIGIFLKSNPGVMYSLNEKTKTYTITNFDSLGKLTRQQQASDFSITVAGNETINGFPCTHLIIKVKNSKESDHYWVGKEFKQSAELQKNNAFKRSKSGLDQALAEKGFGQKMIVKMTSKTEDGGDYTMELVKFEETNIPSSKFSLDGYKRGTDNPIFGSMGGGQELSEAELKELDEVFKVLPQLKESMMLTFKMLPADQRKKMLEELKKNMKEQE